MIVLDWVARLHNAVDCWRGKHYTGVWTTNVGGFYYCVRCEEVLGHYFIPEEKRLLP